ncbi:MAG: tetratricopeptide repeat protein [Chloroflexi bacterium]|nr:tetratricopeptide repeat protein [Chloroflexota bacterium]
MSSEASTLKDAGLRLYREGNYAEAVAKFEAARSAYADAGDRAMAGEMSNNLGLTHRALKAWDAAQTALEAALNEFCEIGDRLREAQALGNLGALAESRGDLKRASDFYQQAIALFGELGEHENRAYTLKALSALQLKQGRQFEALATMDAGLAAAPKLSPTQRLLHNLIKWPMSLLGKG